MYAVWDIQRTVSLCQGKVSCQERRGEPDGVVWRNPTSQDAGVIFILGNPSFTFLHGKPSMTARIGVILYGESKNHTEGIDQWWMGKPTS
jgi:hypothetical protein